MKIKAIIFDRDGTLIKNYGYFCDPSKIKWLKGVLLALKYLKKKKIKCFIVTNQSGIARGFFDEKKLKLFHGTMSKIIKKNRGSIEKFFYCPHHKSAKVKKYKKRCGFRKPNNGYIRKIIKKYNLKSKEILMIGDQKSDYLAAYKSKVYFEYKSNRNNLLHQIKKIIK